MRSPLRWLFLVLASSFCGCASLSPVPPENFDLSGQWQLNAALSDSPSLANLNRGGGRKGGPGARRDGGGGQGRGGPPPGGGRQGGNRGGPSGQQANRPGGQSARSGGVRVGVLRSSTIAIEQSHESMGMEFDNGVYRDVSWGTRVRGELTVETGWDERELVIKSTGGRMPSVERYSISPDGQRLQVVVELNGGRDDLRFLRVFEKRSSVVEN